MAQDNFTDVCSCLLFPYLHLTGTKKEQSVAPRVSPTPDEKKMFLLLSQVSHLPSLSVLVFTELSAMYYSAAEGHSPDKASSIILLSEAAAAAKDINGSKIGGTIFGEEGESRSSNRIILYVVESIH
jgi:hypothetical protein